MTSPWKHPKSRFWTACSTHHEGKQVKRSAKLTNRSKALRVALEFEEAERHAKERLATAVQLHKVVNELTEEVTGDSLITPTVEELLKDWLEGKRSRHAAAGTMRRYAHTVRLFLEFLGKSAQMWIVGVTTKHIEGFLKSRLGAGVAPKTAIVDIQTLKAAFNWAEHLGIILKNPVLPGGTS
jgi:hypothetical protein